MLASDLDGRRRQADPAPPARRSVTGDDEERMLLAMRHDRSTRTLPLPVRIGVNRGYVFAGDIGPPYPPHLHGDGRRGQPGRAA